MKYEIRYNKAEPSPHDVMELMLAVGTVSGDECESIELIQDSRVSPSYFVMSPKPEDEREDWQK